jgi:type I restriction enzyme S subunit
MWQYNTRHTGVARFQYTVFSETEQFGLPDPTTQRKVAAILSAYDDLIANNLRRIKILKEMARAIYREWFVEFRGPGVKLRKATSAEKKAAGKDVFPEGWAVMPIGDVVDTLGGGTPSTKRDEYWEDGDVTWFTPSDLTATGATFIAESGKKITRLGLQKSAARLFPPYSVMMTSRATIGVTAINTGEACTNQGFITCIPNQRVPAVQMYFWIEQHREEIIGVASGATYKEISRSEFREFPIPVADREFGASFVDMMSPLTGQIENLLAKNESLRRTREFLLPRLVSGEVIVRNLNSVTADNPLREVSK